MGDSTRKQRQTIFKRLFFDENKEYDEAKKIAQTQMPIIDKQDASCMKTWYWTQRKRKAGTYKVPVLTEEQREKKRAYDRRPDVIQKHCDANKKRRLEDPRTFREVERRSRENNPINRKLTNFKSDNKRDTIACSLSDEQIIWHFAQPCTYCGVTTNDTVDSLMGIDRVDNYLGFTPENSAPCCFSCNLIKKTLHVKTFLNMVYSIASTADPTLGQHSSVGYNATYHNSMDIKFEKYKNGAAKRAKPVKFCLTRQDFEALCFNKCYYCGLDPDQYVGSGIDRMDNDKDYTVDNCAPCCAVCNLMKQKLSAQSFVSKCIQIFKHCHKNKSY